MRKCCRIHERIRIISDSRYIGLINSTSVIHIVFRRVNFLRVSVDWTLALSLTQPATHAVSNVNKQQLPVARQLRMRTASFYLAADNNRRNEAHLSR